MKGTQNPYLSIVVPVYNEEENVQPLYEKISTVCESIGLTYEVIFVDDGSQDNTYDVLSELRETEHNLSIIKFQENAGQTAAMAAGFEYAQGERIISMDGDLQNDPADIPQLLDKLDEDYDLVCGWRKERHDKFWSRRVPSVIANWIISLVTGVAIHDNGSEVIKQVPLYGEMHRFIPAMSTVIGARITEIVVKHHPRRFGVSKYGLSRIWRVILDIIAFKLILSVFAQQPNPNSDKNSQQTYHKYLAPHINVYRVAALFSLPIFIIGFFLINHDIDLSICFIALGVSIIVISALTGWSIGISKTCTADLSPFASFFIHRCARRPIRYFGPPGTLISAIGGILTFVLPFYGPILLNIGILIFFIGLFGETIAYANAKRVIDYKVDIFLDSKDYGKRVDIYN